MCETRDLGIKWPHQARSVYWKKWAAKHEYEKKQKRGFGFYLFLPCCERRRTKSGLINVETLPHKINSGREWVQKKLFDIGWSDKSACQACHKEEGTEMHRLHHCPEWYEVRREIPEAFRKWEQKACTSKKEWKWQRGIVTHPSQ